MEKIKLEIAGIPAVLYGKRSRRVYLYVHGKNGSAAEAARFARTACPAGWQVLAVDLPEHGTRKNSPEKLVPWVVTRELQAVYARMQPVWKHIRVYGVSVSVRGLPCRRCRRKRRKKHCLSPRWWIWKS